MMKFYYPPGCNIVTNKYVCMFMNVFSQCEYLKAIIMYALNSHQKEGGPYENDSIIFMSTELFFPTKQNTDMKP